MLVSPLHTCSWGTVGLGWLATKPTPAASQKPDAHEPNTERARALHTGLQTNAPRVFWDSEPMCAVHIEVVKLVDELIKIGAHAISARAFFGAAAVVRLLTIIPRSFISLNNVPKKKKHLKTNPSAHFETCHFDKSQKSPFGKKVAKKRLRCLRKTKEPAVSRCKG